MRAAWGTRMGGEMHVFEGDITNLWQRWAISDRTGGGEGVRSWKRDISRVQRTAINTHKHTKLKCEPTLSWLH